MSAGARHESTNEINTNCPKDYTFHIELEFLMIPKEGFYNRVQNGRPGSQRSREHFVNQWTATNKKEKYFVEMASSMVDLETQTWRLVSASLNETKRQGKCPVKIISPIFFYSQFDDWKERIFLMMEFFVENAHLDINAECAFHIHISHISGEWDLEWLRRVARAVVVWDARMRAHGDKGAGSGFCRKHLRPNPEFQAKWRKIWDEISRCKTVNDIPFDKNCAWNFMGTSSLAHGNTLQYQSPRATTNKMTIIKWIGFVAKFVHASIASDDFESVEAALNLNDFLQQSCPASSIEYLCWEDFEELEESEED